MHTNQHAHQHTQHTAIADTGASDHYFTSTAPLLHINPSAPRTTIRTATGESQLSTATAQLGIPSIPMQHAQTGHIMPGFTHNLLSLGKLCDADCTAYLDKHHLLVRDKDGNAILHGVREPSGARLWRVDISPTTTTPAANDTSSPNSATVPSRPGPHCNPQQTQRSTAPARSFAHTRAYDLPNTPALIAYLHAMAGYPVKSSWIQAI